MRVDNLIGTFEAALSALINPIVQRAINGDPELVARLSRLEGRAVQIVCNEPSTTWHIEINGATCEQPLVFRPGDAQSPSVIVSGSLPELAKLMFGADAANVTIDGDQTTLIELTEILESYNPEVAATLSSVLGPALANQVLVTADAGLKGVQSIAQGIGGALRDQAQTNFVSEDNMQDLLSGIDELRLRVDRLAARVREADTRSK